MPLIGFKEFINEDLTKLIIQSGINSTSLDNQTWQQQINVALARATAQSFATPYIALGTISKVLAYASIILPQYIILDQNDGEVVFDASGFGRTKSNPDTEVDGTSHYVYFTYELNEEGSFDVLAVLVTPDELEELIDLADDSEEDVAEEEPVSESTLTERTPEDYQAAKKHAVHAINSHQKQFPGVNHHSLF